MTKAKASKLDKEIQEGLYDPRQKKQDITKMSTDAIENRLKQLGEFELTLSFDTKTSREGHRLWKELNRRDKERLKQESIALGRYNIAHTSIEDDELYDPKGIMTYKEFIKKNLKSAIQDYGSAPAAMKGLAGEWRRSSFSKTYDPRKSYLKGRRFKQYKGYKYIIILGTVHTPLGNTGLAYKTWMAEIDRKEGLRGYDSKPPSRWYEAMVKGIKKSSDVRNPYAIVKSIWSKLSPSKKAEIRAREKKGERFKYNLPLPVDKPTRGTGTVRMVKPFKLAEVQVNMSIKDYLTARASGLFQKMKRHDGTTALVARCKSPEKNVNIFVDKAGK